MIKFILKCLWQRETGQFFREIIASEKVFFRGMGTDLSVKS